MVPVHLFRIHLFPRNQTRVGYWKILSCNSIPVPTVPFKKKNKHMKKCGILFIFSLHYASIGTWGWYLLSHKWSKHIFINFEIAIRYRIGYLYCKSFFYSFIKVLSGNKYTYKYTLNRNCMLVKPLNHATREIFLESECTIIYIYIHTQQTRNHALCSISNTPNRNSIHFNTTARHTK